MASTSIGENYHVINTSNNGDCGFMHYSNLSNNDAVLSEGLRYGNKEKSWILSNLNEFRIGIEIELRAKEKDINDVDFSELHHSSSPIDMTFPNSGFSVSDGIGAMATTITNEFVNMIGDVSFVDGLPRPIIDVLMGVHHDTLSSISSGDENALNAFLDDMDGMANIINPLMAELDNLEIFSDIIELYDVKLDNLLNILKRIDTRTSADELNEYINETDFSAVGDKQAYEESLSNGLYSIVYHYIESNMSELSLLEVFTDFIIDSDNKDFINDFFIKSGLPIGTLFSVYDISEEDLYHSYFNVIPKIDGDLRTKFDFDYEIHEEHDQQIEIKTDSELRGDDIPEAFNEMFDVVSYVTENYAFETTSVSGIHVSISRKDSSEAPNVAKFIILSNILNLIPKDARNVREMVADINELLTTSFIPLLNHMRNDMADGRYSTTYRNHIETWINDSLTTSKFQSVNFEDINLREGRVELRFFGGTGYEQKRELIWDTTIRSFYALSLAYDEDLNHTEYLSSMNKMVEKISLNLLGIPLNEYAVNYRQFHYYMRLLTGNNDMAVSSGKMAMYYDNLFDVMGQLSDMDESTITLLKQSLIKLPNGKFVFSPSKKLIMPLKKLSQ